MSRDIYQPDEPSHDEDSELIKEIEEQVDGEDPYIDPSTTLLEQWAPSSMSMTIDSNNLPLIHVEGTGPESPKTHETMVCFGTNKFQDCKHLAEVVTEFQAGNRGLEKPLTRLNIYCRALGMGGELMDLSGAHVFACSLRDPPCPCGHGRKATRQARADRYEVVSADVIPEWTPPKERG